MQDLEISTKSVNRVDCRISEPEFADGILLEVGNCDSGGWAELTTAEAKEIGLWLIDAAAIRGSEHK